jgi:signal transduction histidine kinase
VEDQGPGIRPEDRERIFDRFERVDPRGQVSGLGLGPYIIRQIVELHGDRIWVEDGGGARFVVELPIARG